MKDFDDLRADVKEIKVDVKEISATLLKNTESLIHHSARTSANEERILQMERWLLGFLGSAVAALCVKLFLH